MIFLKYKKISAIKINKLIFITDILNLIIVANSKMIKIYLTTILIIFLGTYISFTICFPSIDDFTTPSSFAF